MADGAFGAKRRYGQFCPATGKVQWLGRAGAAEEARVMRQREGRDSTLEAYECRSCGDYHVGHRRPKAAARG